MRHTVFMYSGLPLGITDRVLSEFNSDLEAISIKVFADKLKEWGTNEKSESGLSEEEYIETTLPWEPDMDRCWGITSQVDLDWIRRGKDRNNQFRPMREKIIEVLGQLDNITLSEFITYLMKNKGYNYKELYYRLWYSSNDIVAGYKYFETTRKELVSKL